jgi:pectate lyase
MGRTREHPKRSSLLIFAAMLVSLLSFTKAAQSYEGFGATTPGGSGKPIVHVTNLNDSGLGSLREAIKQGNRTIVFDVGGEILLGDYLYVLGAFITIDGSTAPSPGITLRNRGLIIRGNKGAHDVIVRGLRVRGSPIDGIQVAYGAYNVVIDHVSVQGSGDENIEITGGSHDITVSWSILAGTGKNMLIKYNHPSRITLHHNVFTEGLTRNPQVRIDDAGTPATDTTVDMRNNLIWDWGIGYGTLVWYGPRANIVNNYYSSSGDAITVSSARAYVQGNVSADKIDVNRQGNETSPFPAPLVDTQDACTAPNLVLANAGVRPLDSIDQQYLSRITIASCSATSPSLAVSPDGLALGATVGGPVPPSQALTISNEGGGTLRWDATVTTTNGGSWISVSPTSGTAPSALIVTANPLGLSEGLYHGTITVTAATATNSPRSIPVTLVIDRPPTGSETLQPRIARSEDDSTEDSGGTVRLTAGQLFAGRNFLPAFRFVQMTIPQGAVIESAMLQMYGLGNLAKSIKVRYQGEATGDSAPHNPVPGDLSSRPTTAAFVDDIPEPWTVGGFNPSPDLRSIIQEIIDHPDWVSGSSLTLFIADKGSSASRTIGTFESQPSPTKAAILTITYQAP